MTLKEVTEPSAAEDQLHDYNDSTMVQTAGYTPAAGTNWAMIGLVLADAVVAGDETTLVAAIENLSAISNVANPRVFSGIQTTLDETITYTHEFRLYVTAMLSCETGFTNNRYNEQSTKSKNVAVPDGKKWMVVNCVLASAFANQAAVTALQTALEGIAGIQTAKIMLYGTVPADATGITLTVEARRRIDPVGA